MKSKLQRLISLLLCLGMILCIAGCTDNTGTSSKKKKKKVIIKKKPTSSDELTESNIDDDVSFGSSTNKPSYDFSEESYTTKTIKDYTVNGIPRTYLTTANAGIKFQRRDEDVKVYSVSELDRSTGTIIEVEPNTTYQTMQGFGASMTGSTVYNLETMPAETRDQLMTRLFDPNKGIGVDILRQPIGCGDYDYEYYTFNEVPQSEIEADLRAQALKENPNLTDDELLEIEFDTSALTEEMIKKYAARFDFSYATEQYVETSQLITPLLPEGTQINLATVPYIHQAQKLNPDIMFVGSVWTAPRWMKTMFSWNTQYDSHKKENKGNALRQECYQVYADYYVRCLQEFSKQGIDFYMVTPSNEPTGQHGIPATYYSEVNMGKMVNYYLRPAFDDAGLETKLFTWDFNWFEDALNFVGTQYGNIDGVAFHFYGGDETIVKDTYELFPDLEIFITETAGNDQGGQPQQLFRQISWMHKLFRYGGSSWIIWNITLDTLDDLFKTRGPAGDEIAVIKASGGDLDKAKDNMNKRDMSVYGTGLTEYDPATGKLVYLMDFYALAHVSKYVQRGAKFVEATDANLIDPFLYDFAFVNPDGTAVIVLGNEGVKDSVIKIVFEDKVIEYAVPGSSVATLAWDANVYL